MGIKDINKLLKEVAPQAFMTVPLTVFSNKKIAIDAHLRIHEFMSITHTNVIKAMNNPLDVIDYDKILKLAIEMAMEFNMTLFSYRITPVWIFDGPPVASKMKCLKDRKAEKMKRIEKVEIKREELASKHVLKVTKEDFDSFKHTLCQNIKIGMAEINEFRRVFTSLGIPNFVAKGDGEKLCSALAREPSALDPSGGVIVGVWSCDTDNYALGTPILIKKFGNKISNVHQVEIVHLPTILNVMNIDLTFLVDLCIMCGCDFNENMYMIGIKKSLILMRQHLSIDNLPSHFKNTPLNREVLDHINCREAFAYEPSGIMEEDIIIDWDAYLINIRDVSGMYIVRDPHKFISYTGF